MPVILNAQGRPLPGTLADATNDAQYVRPRPYSELFVACLRATLQVCDDPKAHGLYLAFGQRPGSIRDARYVGVFTARFEGWKLTVNWTPEKKDNLPPGHIVVSWRDFEVAMLSPFTDGLPVDGVPCENWWHELVPVSEDDLQEACARAIAAQTRKDRLFAAYDGERAQARKQLALA